MKKIVQMKFGSHLYGLNTPASDTDFKGIYLPELDDLLLGNVRKTISESTGNEDTKNTEKDVDSEWISLGEFVRLACKGETVAVDMLHANQVNLGEYGFIWEYLVTHRTEFFSTSLSSYMGYVKKQAAKYGLKGGRIAAMREAIAALTPHANQGILMGAIWDELPESEFLKKLKKPFKGDLNQMDQFYEVNGKKYQSKVTVDYALSRIQFRLNTYGARALLAEKNEGVDWKAVSHALRAGFQMRDIFTVGTFSYPLKETNYLLDVKLGQCDYMTEVAPVLEDLVSEINTLVVINKLGFPASADTDRWNKWLLSIYLDVLVAEDVR